MLNNHKSKTPKISNSSFACYKVRGTVPEKALPFYPPTCSEWFLPSVSLTAEDCTAAEEKGDHGSLAL